MSQSPIHLRPKAKRTFHWEEPTSSGKPRPPRRQGKKLRPWMRQTALALALCLLTGCYAILPPESAATAVTAPKRELPVYSVERSDDVIAVTFDAS